jgi:tRNA(fMet)-specific endonuclease VapC
LRISPIVVTALLHAAANSARPIKTGATSGALQVGPAVIFSTILTPLPHAGDIRAMLERECRQIGGYDGPIAGHARTRDLAVVMG